MIHIRKSTIPKMLDLMEKMNQGEDVREPLNRLLDHPDYQMELERYSSHHPDTRFTREEFLNFFINIRHLENLEDLPRGLRFRRNDLIEIMDHVDHYRKINETVQNFSEADVHQALERTYAGLPNTLEWDDIHLIFNIGIGMSGGYIYKNFTQYDLKIVIGDRSHESLMNTIAHETHHMGFDIYLQSLKEEDLIDHLDAALLVYLAGEGTAIKYCNNFEGKLTKKLYDHSDMDVDQVSYVYYMENFDDIYKQFKKDLKYLKRDGKLEQLGALFMKNYFYTDVMVEGKLVQNYLGQPLAYHFGADLWGLLHDVHGKDRVFELLLKPSEIIQALNQALVHIGREDLLI